mgnify:FL=1
MDPLAITTTFINQNKLFDYFHTPALRPLQWGVNISDSLSSHMYLKELNTLTAKLSMIREERLSKLQKIAETPDIHPIIRPSECVPKTIASLVFATLFNRS